jgi:CDP-paratose 2-epimerase
MASANDRLGVCQWFHYRDRETVLRAVDLLRELGVKHLRTGISWADDHRHDGPDWHDWVMQQLEGFELLLSVWHTPPSISRNQWCNGPPKRLEAYAEFLEELTARYGDRVHDIELWNEPNNRLKWDFIESDPQWELFGEMIRLAAERMKALGRRTVLGGMIPVDPAWLEGLRDRGALEHVDVVAIHGFPEMWWPDHPNWDWFEHWKGWGEKVEKTRAVAPGPVWITETGLATWDLQAGRKARHGLQSEMLRRAHGAPSERVYWYSLIDLDPQRDAIEGYHVDENEYHLGLVEWNGRRKPAFQTFRELIGARPPVLAP